MSNKADKKIQELFDVVQGKKREIEIAEKPNWKTNCSFRLNEETTNGSFNLHTVSDINLLITSLGRLKSIYQNSLIVAEQLGIKDYKFRWLGYSFEDWFSDFQTRINKININKKKEELQSLETRLNSLISPELRRELELKEIEKQLMS